MAWYCIQTRTGKEYTARDSLADQDVWAYLPEIPRDWRHYKPRKYNMMPLFTGYLFAYLEPGISDFRLVNKTPGVIRVVKFGTEPTPLTEADIEMIRQVEAEMRPLPDYKKGDRVRVKAGSFEGYEATFLMAKNGRERADVLLTMLGENRRIRLKLRDLEPAA